MKWSIGKKNPPFQFQISAYEPEVHPKNTLAAGRAYKAEKSASLPLPDNCVMTPVFQDGSLLFQYTHKHSSTLVQASFAHKIDLVFVFLSQDLFKVPPGHTKVPPDHYKGSQATSKGHTPLLIPVAAMGKCKQANEFQ